MVGFECKAEWFDKEHMPDFVKPKQTFWSKRPPIENSIGFIVAEVLMWFIWVKICMHELCSIYSGMTCKADIGHIKHQHTYNMQHMQYATCSQECNSYEAVYYTKYITTRSCCITMYMQHTCSNTYAPYNEHL